MCMHYLKRPEEGDRFPETGIVAGSKMPCGFWDSSKESLEGQLVLFTAEESLQPHVTSLKQHSLNVYSVPATLLHVQCLKS